MKTGTVAKVALWFILFLALLGAGFEMVSKPSTIWTMLPSVSMPKMVAHLQ